MRKWITVVAALGLVIGVRTYGVLTSAFKDPMAEAHIAVYEAETASVGAPSERQIKETGETTSTETASESFHKADRTHKSEDASDTHRALAYHEASGKWIDLKTFNAMSAEDLVGFKGIGDKTAEAILEDRRTNGPVEQFDDLRRIKGIGTKKLQKILLNSP